MSRPYRILAFGDSITAFRGELKVASLIVQKYLNENGFNAQVLNCGIPGNNTEDGMARFERDVLDLHPDIVWMMFGTNDSAIDVSQGKTEPRVSLKAYEDNVSFMLRAMKNQGITPLVVSSPALVMTESLKPFYDMPPYSEKGFNFMLVQYIEKLKHIAESEDCSFINIFEKYMKLTGGDEHKLHELLPDGMHPGQEGQELIAEEVIKWISDDNGPLSQEPSSDVGTLQYERLESDKSSFRMEITTVKGLDLLEMRYRNHDNAKMTEYSAWEKIPFSISEDSVETEFNLPESGTYTVQLKSSMNGKTTAVGKVDFVLAE